MDESTQPSGDSSSAGPAKDSGASSHPGPAFPLRMLADGPVDDEAADWFGYGDIADGLVRLIEGEGTATPLTIAISAPWGAGKTSLLRLVEDRVVRQRIDRHEPPTIVVWFNAWMHDGAPSLSAALAADIARRATRCRSVWIRLRHPLPTSMLSPKERARRRFWFGVVAFVFAIAIYPLVSKSVAPPGSDATEIRAWFGASAVAWFALLWGISVLWPRVRRSVAAVAAFVDDPRSAAATGSMTEVSDQLGVLIREAQDGVRRAWGAKQQPRFLVVVDDLERCQPPKAVDMCEVAAQLLDHPGVITMLVGDLRVIASSAELKYRDAASQSSDDADFAAGGWGHAYLQKVVQFVLELPPISKERLRRLGSAPATASIHGRPAERSALRPSFIWRLLHPTAAGPVPRLGMVFAFLVWLVVVISIHQINSTWGMIVTLMFASALWILLVITFLLANQRRHEENLLREVRDLVDNVISGVRTEPGAPTASADLEDEVIRRLGEQTARYKRRPYWREARKLASPEEVRRRMQLAVTADEKILSSANEVILELLPSIPRAAKRLFNRLYFLLVVAYNRKLIGKDRVSVEQLAKWAVLLDRWPQAGRAVVDNPQRVHALEAKAGNEDEFSNLCSTYKLRLAGDMSAFRDFFLSKHKLAPAVYRLVYLDPNVKSPPPSGTPLSEQAGQTEQAQVSPTGDMSPSPVGVASSDEVEGTKASVTTQP